MVATVVAVVGTSVPFVMSPGGAASAAPLAGAPNTEIVLSVDADGTAAFDTDPVTPTTTHPVAHTPGSDGSANNGVVRTYDSVRYRIDWNVNEVDATGARLSATLPEGVRWKADPSGLVAPGCASDSDGSSISADGRTLVCVLGEKKQGTAGTVFPVAEVLGLLDDDVVSLRAVVDTDQTPPVTSQPAQVTVSATARADWVKGVPDEITDVVNGGVPGRLLIYPISLNPGSGGRKGSSPLDDSYTYNFFDNAWGLATGAVLAPQSLLDTYAGGRTSCGGYDGAGELPLGRSITGRSTAINTTAGGLAGGTFSCTDGAVNDFVVAVSVGGQNTATAPAYNASGRRNAVGTTIAGQIAWWVPEAELRARAGQPPLPQPAAGGLNLGNDISATAATITYPPNPATTLTPPAIAPIQVRVPPGTLVDENGTANNRAENQILFVQTLPGTRTMRSFARFTPGPFREVRSERADGSLGYSQDLRQTAVGGQGNLLPGSSLYGDGLSQASRDETVTLWTGVMGTANQSRPYLDDQHLCTGIDTDNMQLVPFPSTFQLATAASRLGNAPTLSTTSASSNAGPLAHARAGRGEAGLQVPAGPFSSVKPRSSTVPVVVEFAHTAAGYRATPTPLVGNPDSIDPSANGAPPPVGDVDANVDTAGLSCNNDDADGRGWVASTGDLSAFDSDGDGRYEGINLVRVSTLQPLDWQGGTTFEHGAIDLFLQVKVGRDTAGNPTGSELYAHTSRAYSSWNRGAENAPQVEPFAGECFDAEVGIRIDPDTVAPNGQDRLDKGGWCSLPYAQANEGVGLDPNSLDIAASDNTTAVWHSDKLTIVEAAPRISKVNVDGLQDYVRNGDTATFQIQPRVVGAPSDTVSAISVVDTLPAQFSLVSATPAPDQVSGQTLTWNFGNQAGGWTGPVITVTVRTQNAGPNLAIRNEARIQGVKNGDTAPTTVRASAFAYTPPAYRESTISKDVGPMTGPCRRYPTTPGSASFPTAVASSWPDNCSMTTPDGALDFTLTAANTGGERLTDYRIVDVFPHTADTAEPQDGFDGAPDSSGLSGDDGDGRTPPSTFAGTVGFGSVTGVGAGDTVLYTADAPGSISRDPDESSSQNTWCSAASGGTAVFGSGACPTGAASVTGIMIRRAELLPGATVSYGLRLTTSGNACDDLYTNSFGSRASGTPATAPAPTATDMRLEMRSNDVSAMVGCPVDLALTKTPAPGQSGPFYVGSTVGFVVTVLNQGGRPVQPATVADYVPEGMTYRASDNAGRWGPVDVTGPGVIRSTVAGPIARGASAEVPLTLRIDATATPGALVNRAELSGFDLDGDPTNGDWTAPDPLDVPGDGVSVFTDVDSAPDEEVGNDVGGVPGGPTDDLVTSTPTSPTNPDEDDADPAQIQVDPSPDLALAKAVASPGPFFAGSVVEFTLTPANVGAAEAAAGWSVTEVLPAGMTLVSASGTGYTCAGSTCVADGPLAAGDTGAPVTVSARIDAGFVGSLHNVAYVSPADGEAPEINPLVVPTTTTNTDSTGTNNDAQADLAVGSLVSIGDYAWVDVDGDGQQDSGEPPLAGVQVRLLDAGGVEVATTTTDAAGFYSFVDLVPDAAYTLEFTPPAGFSLTTAGDGPGETDSDPDPSTGRVAVTAPASGVNSRTAPDDASLDAGFVSLNLTLDKEVVGDGPWYAGSTITFRLTPRNEGPVRARAGWSVTEVLPAGLTLVSMAGSGYDCDPLPTCVAAAALPGGENGPAVTVTARIGPGVKGPLNNVAWVGPADGEIPETSPLVIPAAGTNTDETATDNDAQAPFVVAPLVSLGGSVWLDADGDGVREPGEAPRAGVTVTIRDAGGTVVGTAVTDTSGAYVFTDLLPGTQYVVSYAVPSGYRLSPQGAGTPGTDSDPDPATARVTVTTPDDGDNSAAEPDVAAVDAGLVALRYAVGDTVWRDADLDGMQDRAEPGVAGVTVRLLDADGLPAVDADGQPVPPVVTGADGRYLFDNLLAGTYRVGFSDLPGGLAFTAANAGADGSDSDADPRTGITAPFDLRSGAPGVSAVAPGDDDIAADFMNPTVDTGLRPPGNGSIGDLVFVDADSDGRQDPGEPGVAGVRVTVTWLGPDGRAGGGDDVAFTRLTDASGRYLVTGLPAGAYTVTVDPRSFPTRLGPSSDLDGGSAVSTSLTLGPGQARRDADFALADPLVGNETPPGGSGGGGSGGGSGEGAGGNGGDGAGGGNSDDGPRTGEDPSDLAFTGAHLAVLAVLGTMLVAFGIVVLVIVRRRRSRAVGAGPDDLLWG
ncbi:MAG: SdrD B-like domain-containing protein [Dermatophilaceae bacterium]